MKLVLPQMPQQELIPPTPTPEGQYGALPQLRQIMKPLPPTAGFTPPKTRSIEKPPTSGPAVKDPISKTSRANQQHQTSRAANTKPYNLRPQKKNITPLSASVPTTPSLLGHHPWTLPSLTAPWIPCGPFHLQPQRSSWPCLGHQWTNAR